MTSLNFCFPTTFYPPYSFGGDAIAVQRLARALVSQGHRVTVIHDLDAYHALSVNQTMQSGRADDGVEVIPLRSSIGRLSPLLAQQTGEPTVHRSTLRDLFSRRGFDVVNFHNSSLIGAPGIFSLAGNSARIYTAHEHWLVCPTHVLWRHKKELCADRQCLKCQLVYHRPPQVWRHSRKINERFGQIDRYIALSEFSRMKHAELGFRYEMHVIPPFVPVPASTESSEAEESPHVRPYFFFAGRLEEIKGVHTVIPQLGAVPHADLIVAGDGPYRNELEMISGSRVRFLGTIDADRLMLFYRHAIATLVPSISYETFGLTLIESFACGTPVIARRLGPFPEIVEACDGGLLFSSDEELGAAMRSLSTDIQLRKRLSVNALRGHRSHWSEETVVPRYLELVDSARKVRH